MGSQLTMAIKITLQEKYKKNVANLARMASRVAESSGSSLNINREYTNLISIGRL